MNVEEARQLLPLYRHGAQADSRIAKAVRIAEADEHLRNELQAQTEFDRQMLEVIRYIEPPENLWGKLNSLETPSSPAPSKRRQLLNPAILCAVAGVLLLIGFGVWRVIAAADDFPGRGRVEGFIKMNERMTPAEFTPTQSKAGELNDNMMLQGFNGFAIPDEVAALPAVGWRVFRDAQSSHRVAQFVVEKDNMPVSVFVFRASDFGVQPDAPKRWRTFEAETWAAAITERGGICTVLTFRGNEADMNTFLTSIHP